MVVVLDVVVVLSVVVGNEVRPPSDVEETVVLQLYPSVVMNVVVPLYIPSDDDDVVAVVP